MKKVIVFIFLFFNFLIYGQSSFRLAVLKYNGGGDYYANPSSLPNLIKFCNKNLNTSINPDVPYVEAGSRDILQYLSLIHI